MFCPNPYRVLGSRTNLVEHYLFLNPPQDSSYNGIITPDLIRVLFVTRPRWNCFFFIRSFIRIIKSPLCLYFSLSKKISGCILNKFIFYVLYFTFYVTYLICHLINDVFFFSSLNLYIYIFVRFYFVSL